MSPGALSGLTAGLVFLSLAASTPSMAKAPPSPPGPPRPASRKVVIRPVPEAPGHYLLQQNRADTLFTGTGLALRLAPPERPARELHWGLAGARSVTPQPLEPREARFHQLVGPRENWKQNLPTWGALYYPEVAPGVDLWFEAREGGVAYSLRAERGAELRQVRLEWRGAQALRLAEGGRALEVVLADGVLREEGLLCGQEAVDGTSFEVPCRFRDVRPKGADVWEYVIEVDVTEPGRPAWVDPSIQWNTFVGASGNDSLQGLTVLQQSGEVFLVGSSGHDTLSSMAPLGTGQASGIRGRSDVVAARLNSDGSVRWLSVFGGQEDDFGKVLVIGAGHDVFVAGTTYSPSHDGGTPMRSGPTDGFIARLASNGSTLYWFNYLGGSGTDDIHSMVLSPDGKRLYAAGGTSSPGGQDFFVSRIDVDGGVVERTRVWSGSRDEVAYSLVVEPGTDGGMMYVTGYTESTDFPMGVSPVSSNTQTDGGREAVVLKVTHELTSPVWGTFIGGQGQDEGRGVLYVPETRRVMVVGSTTASDFPKGDAGTHPSGTNAFLASFDPVSGERLFSTVVGGAGDDEGLAITSGSFHSIYLGGRTDSVDLPVPFGFDTQSSGGEGFVIRMAHDAGVFAPTWGSYVGGSMIDEVLALASGPGGDQILLGGVSASPEMLPMTLPGSGDKTESSGGEEMFLIALPARDPTPPVVGMVNDGRLSGDSPSTDVSTFLLANWSFSDPETGIARYYLSVGTVPGCSDIVSRMSLPGGNNGSIELSSERGQIPMLTPGMWYFVTIEAENGVALTTSDTSNGLFVTFPDGSPTPPPPMPPPGTPCPGTPDGGQGDGGTADGGQGDGGEPTGPDGGGGGPGYESPLGWSCGTPGGPSGFVLLVVVAFGLLSARRKGWS